MILLFSHKQDLATSKIEEKIKKAKNVYCRINADEFNKLNLAIINGSNTIIQNGIEIDLNNIKVSWYRNGFLFEDNYKNAYIAFSVKPDLLKFHLKELEYLNKYLFQKIENKPHFGSYTESDISKLLVLEKANNLGFNIPKTIVTTSKKQLNYFDGKIITKPIYEGPKLIDGEYLLRPFTTKVNIDDIEEEFFPSLFQEKIHALCELRIFFFGDKYFAASIHCEEYDETVDWRYIWAENKKIELRKFELSDEFLINLKKLSADIGINTGSYDFIVNKEGDIFFLEVNPCGQFSFLDVVFGDEIYECIAQTLMNVHNEISNTNNL
jgi:hypothetical protein